MNRGSEISQKPKDDLQDAIRSKLFILPAFRLKGKQIDVIKNYALRSLSKEIDESEFDKRELQSISYNTLDQSSQATQVTLELYGFRGFLKKSQLLYRMISKITCIKLITTILSFSASCFLVRQANVWVRLAGLFSVLIHSFSFLSFWKDVILLCSLINNTFNFIHRIQREIQSYIDDIFLIQRQEKKEFKDSIEIVSNKVTKEFIQEEIRQLDYESKKIHLFPLVFAFCWSFIVIYVTGDTFVILLKYIANWMHLLEFFPIIKNLTVQTFWLIFLFPLSIAWVRDLIVESSKRYSRKLHQSLFLIDEFYKNE